MRASTSFSGPRPHSIRRPAFNLRRVRLLLELTACLWLLHFSQCGASIPGLKKKTKTLVGPQCLSPALVRSHLFCGNRGSPYMFFEIALMQRYSIVLGHPPMGLPLYCGAYWRPAASEAIFKHVATWGTFGALSISSRLPTSDCTSPGVVPYAYLSTLPTRDRILAT